MSATKIEISKGVQGVFIENSRFKTTLVSFNFYLPLSEEKVSSFGLLPFVLTTCGKDYPTFKKLNIKLNKLYGAELSASTEKTGDFQLLKMDISVIADKYALDGEMLTEEAINLLTSLVFEPKTQNGAFFEVDVEREKRKAIEHIKGEFSDKRVYAKERLISEMYKGTAFGVPKCGTVESVSAIDGENLFCAWQEMLKSAFVRVNVVASTMPQGLFDSLSQRFGEIERDNITDLSVTTKTPPVQTPRIITEKTEVNQGKLVMGFSCEKETDSNNPDLFVATDIFGGGPYSKLFTNVREKMSLCYYCSARSNIKKGLVTVESGIESKNAEKAQSAIIEQLKILQDGKLTDEEFNSSVLGLTDSLNTYYDSSVMLEKWYSIRFSDEEMLSPSDLAERIKKLSKEDVVKAAKGIKLHTTFVLLPEVDKQ